MELTEGIVVPLLTPFTADDEVNEASLRTLIDHVITAGVSGLVANSGTGEFFTLSNSEQQRCTEITVEQAAGRVPVLSGASSSGTRLTIELARTAQRAGAQGLMVTAPYFEGAPFAQIKAHYAAISDAVDIPLMVYSAPYSTQILLSPEQLAELVEAANIRWFKLSTSQIQQIPITRPLLNKPVYIFEGWDTLAFASMVNASVGWIAGPSNVIPELAVRLYRLVKVEKRIDEARELNERLLPLLDMLERGGAYPGIMKKVARMRGLETGPVRLPNAEVDAGAKAKLRTIIKALDLGPYSAA